MVGTRRCSVIRPRCGDIRQGPPGAGARGSGCGELDGLARGVAVPSWKGVRRWCRARALSRAARVPRRVTSHRVGVEQHEQSRNSGGAGPADAVPPDRFAVPWPLRSTRGVLLKRASLKN